MALRLEDLIISGELINRENYSTHGWMRLRGHEQTLLLQLTGNCQPDLAGKHIRFEAPDADEREQNPELIDFDFEGLAWQQVGPTGEMTADRMVKVSGGSAEEIERRPGLEEPLPFGWKRCLYLEWFSQNGRVVVELVDPVIEFVDPDEEDDDLPDDADLPAAQLDDDFAANAAAEDISADELMDDEEDEGEDLAAGFEPDDEFDADNDPYGLFPAELQQHLDREASQLDDSLEDEESKPRSIREMELMDELIEGGEGDIIASIFDEPVKLPRPEQLNDEQVESALKTLLAQLALFGIALSICRHFTPRDAYRLLLEEICTEERAYPQLRNTQWVQHFMTSEFCEACEAEMEQEFEEYERQRGEESDNDSPGDELPF